MSVWNWRAPLRPHQQDFRPTVICLIDLRIICTCEAENLYNNLSMAGVVLFAKYFLSSPWKFRLPVAVTIQKPKGTTRQNEEALIPHFTIQNLQCSFFFLNFLKWHCFSGKVLRIQWLCLSISYHQVSWRNRPRCWGFQTTLSVLGSPPVLHMLDPGIECEAWTL